MMFTPEELAELKRADEEIDNAPMTLNDYRESRIRDRAARSDKKNARTEYCRAYYYANREKCKAKQRAYYKRNREKIAGKQRTYFSENRESINACRREWYMTYYAENPDKHEARKAYMREWRRKQKGAREA